MAPLPPIWDPAKAADKLPQPFRMIDKIVSEIIELAVDEIVRKDKQRKHLKTINTKTHFAPHAVLLTEGNATCFATLGVAGLAVAGCSSGGLVAFTARDNTAIGKDDTSHTSAVSAMDSGHVSATSTKVLVSASAGHLAVHDVIIKTAELVPLAITELPFDADDPGVAPTSVHFSPNSAHIAVCYPSGALAIYELHLPPSYYVSGKAETSTYSAPLDTVGGNKGQLSLCVHFPLAVVRKLLVGCFHIGTVNVVWRVQQRPDKSGKSDRFHKPAKGIYMWWQGCNKLALSRLCSSSPRGPSASPHATPAAADAVAPAAEAAQASKPVTPLKGAAGKDGKAGAVAAEDSVLDASMDAGAVKIASEPDKGWLLPHGITASTSTEDGNMMAFGLADGSVLIWDDTTTCHTKILKRLPGAVCALAYVNGTAVRLFATSTDGTMFVANLERPEDSYTAAVKLPHAAHTVFFLPNDPFAFIIINGCMSYTDEPVPRTVVQRPARFYWFHMVEQTLVAECTGKEGADASAFGSAGSFRQPGVWLEAMKGVKPAEEPPAAATTAGKGTKGGGTKDAPPLLMEPSKVEEPAAVVLDPLAPAIDYPRWFIRDSYLIAGGSLIKSPSWRPPKGMMEEEVPDEMWPRQSQLFLYKLDALSRYLLPEEMKSNSAKSMLDRMLAELNPIKKKIGKHVKMDVPDPDAPKPLPGVLRKAGEGGEDSSAGDDDDDAKSSVSIRKHIMFDVTDGLFDDSANPDKKIFKKETVKGGYSQKKDPNEPSDPNKPDPVVVERPKSPPWHHTNPLARIHPDWEEAPVLTRVMERLGNKGGGRRRRDFNLRIANDELSERLEKEPGTKPRLLNQPKVKA